MSSAFQSNAFQNNAFQIENNGGVSPTPTPIRPSGGYALPYSRYEHLQRIEEQRAELARVEQELSLAEHNKLEKLEAEREDLAKLRAKKKAAKQLAALEASLQEEINELRNQRAWLMRLIDDEEAILVLLLSYPLH